MSEDSVSRSSATTGGDTVNREAITLPVDMLLGFVRSVRRTSAITAEFSERTPIELGTVAEWTEWADASSELRENMDVLSAEIARQSATVRKPCEVAPFDERVRNLIECWTGERHTEEAENIFADVMALCAEAAQRATARKPNTPPTPGTGER